MSFHISSLTYQKLPLSSRWLTNSSGINVHILKIQIQVSVRFSQLLWNYIPQYIGIIAYCLLWSLSRPCNFVSFNVGFQLDFVVDSFLCWILTFETNFVSSFCALFKLKLLFIHFLKIIISIPYWMYVFTQWWGPVGLMCITTISCSVGFTTNVLFHSWQYKT